MSEKQTFNVHVMSEEQKEKPLDAVVSDQYINRHRIGESRCMQIIVLFQYIYVFNIPLFDIDIS